MPIEAPTQDLLTVPEVMGLLHWSRPTVYRLINSGELPAIRTGTGKGRGHSYALHSLQAGVPIATLARQMGHSDVSRTFTVYGGWVREMGADAAALRGAWILAGGANAALDTAESP